MQWPLSWDRRAAFALEPPYLYEMYVVIALLAVLAFWEHRANIKPSHRGNRAENVFIQKSRRNKNMAKISIIGAGSWGTALGLLLCNNGHDVTICSEK